MAKSFKCEECHSIFIWKPKYPLEPTCPNCGNTDVYPAKDNKKK